MIVPSTVSLQQIAATVGMDVSLNFWVSMIPINPLEA